MMNNMERRSRRVEAALTSLPPGAMKDAARGMVDVWLGAEDAVTRLERQLAELATSHDRLMDALSHIASTREWMTDNPDERVAYLQGVARDALERAAS